MDCGVDVSWGCDRGVVVVVVVLRVGGVAHLVSTAPSGQHLMVERKRD